MSTLRATNYGSSFDHLKRTNLFNGLARIIPSKIFEATVQACFSLVERSQISEPHFLWEDINTATISPSEYQFACFEDYEFDFVSIDEEDIPYREFCSDALNALDLYASLSDNWDDDGAPAPSESSLRDAALFLRGVSSWIETCPNIVAMLDFEGIPSFAFDSDSRYISVAFYGEESLITYSLDRIKNTSTSTEFLISDAASLSEFLEAIASL